jgi:DNA-entry nuclease
MIAFQLTGENANRENLVTGTRYMNEAMIPFENQIADYIKEEVTNHVMYRVTVIFKGNNLLCEGVLLEAYSVEDDGEEISLNVFLYNVQPGVVIDYATGASEAEDKDHEDNVVGECKYVLNTNSKKIHKPTCGNVKTISEKNRKETDKSIEELLEEGYTKGGCCNPS